MSYQKFELPLPLFTEIEQPTLLERATITVVGNALICTKISVTHLLERSDGLGAFYLGATKSETKKIVGHCSLSYIKNFSRNQVWQLFWGLEVCYSQLALGIGN